MDWLRRKLEVSRTTWPATTVAPMVIARVFAALLLTACLVLGYQVLRRTGSGLETDREFWGKPACRCAWKDAAPIPGDLGPEYCGHLTGDKGYSPHPRRQCSATELRLDVEQLRHYGVLYTPVSNNVQFRMEVSSTSQQILSESVLA